MTTPLFLRTLIRAVHARTLRRRAQPLALPPSGERVLMLAPHPDDDALGAGALLAELTSRGVEVHIAYLTDGEASHRGHPILEPRHVGALRQAEARTAAAALRVPSERLTFCQAPDGQLSQLSPAATQALGARIATLRATLRPRWVLAPTSLDGSSEHAAARRIIAGHGSGPGEEFDYLVWAWWSPVLLALIARDPDLAVWRGHHPVRLAAKANAIAAHRSQLHPTAPWPCAVLPVGFAAAFHTTEEFLLQTSRETQLSLS
jgi:LmbE family N-acetylglucosaminyl deacetylase